MLDLNHKSPVARINAALDAAMVAKNAQEEPRTYLGGSRLGHHCDRALQYEYTHTPKDEGREFNGKVLRIFQRGHAAEDWAVAWFRSAGFDLRTRGADGEQFGFSVLDGKIRGHCDGVFVGGPAYLQYPALWECKCLNNKNWQKVQREKLAKAKPIYDGQVAVYQAYFQLTDNPAIFTAINADTMDLYHEIVPFNGELAQACSDRGVRVVRACEARQLLPRCTDRADWWECKFCDYRKRCWS